MGNSDGRLPEFLESEDDRLLQSLLPLWPHEARARDPETKARRLALLRKALREERCRGLAGHWTYDLARHVQLHRLYRRLLECGVAAPGGAPLPTAKRKTASG